MLLDRLDDLTRTFETVLVVGGRNPELLAGLPHARATKGAQMHVIEQSALLARRHGFAVGEEDRLPIEPGQYDCILWPGGLESVNDVPGALLRCRLGLRGDGLLLGCLLGDGSFPALRAAMRAADGDRIVSRLHPQIDTRAMGDLLSRTGFAMAVADSERITLRYAGLADLVADIRAAALGNVLSGPIQPISRQGWGAACMAFATMADADGRTAERVQFVHFSGWAPHPDQAGPARRGSATASLASVLRARPDTGATE